MSAAVDAATAELKRVPGVRDAFVKNEAAEMALGWWRYLMNGCFCLFCVISRRAIAEAFLLPQSVG